MRYRNIVLVSALLLLASCDVGVHSNGKPKAYPLQSKVGFHIGPAINMNCRLSLFLWTTAGFHTACNEIDGTFWFHPSGRHIKCSVENLIDLNVGCSAVYTTAFDEWPFPDLSPGVYDFEMVLYYGYSALVKDTYAIEVIAGDSLIVTPIKNDSSFYHAGDIDWWGGAG